MSDNDIITTLDISIKVMRKGLEEPEEDRGLQAFRLLGAIQATFITLSIKTDNQALKERFEAINQILNF